MKVTKESRRWKIKMRIRKNVAGNTQRPRLSVFRSNTAIYAQLIDDTKGITLLSASSKELVEKGKNALNKDLSKQVGLKIAEKAKAAGIDKVVFDRGGYLYHGNVQSLAEGVREGGLIF